VRVTFRSKDVKTYWEERWGNIPADVPMGNVDAYPLKYSEMIVDSKEGAILEAGCGVGRVLRYYHERGYNITGMDYIDVAIEKLRRIDETLSVAVGDITALQFDNESFRYVLAFGLYHNLQEGLDRALSETLRVLESGGKVCASFRADNLQTRLVDWLADRRDHGEHSEKIGPKKFHKLNLNRGECGTIFERAGFKVDRIMPVENMPLLYKFAFFRSRSHKQFDENLARSEGYQLSWLGRVLQSTMMRSFPNQFCNIYVLIAHKPHA
jgi:SAM-dependent methyltransferase